ncbi:Ig-like domain-containing protein, partial [Candidatus Marinimicrobia bacterium]|nr:Ig-like domain-containing protein [Candidatus Neomarinimicrobiota bacterium]
HIINILTFLSIISFSSCNDNKGDTSAPEVSITFPENGAVVNEIVTISANATDNEEIDFVQFFVNDSLDSALVSVEPYLFNWNTNNIDDGNYTIAVIAQDASNNTSDTLQLNLTVDNTLSSPSAVEIIDISYSLNLMSIRFNKSVENDFNDYTILTSNSVEGSEKSEIGKIVEVADTLFTTTDFNPIEELWYYVKVTDIYGYSETSQGFRVKDSAPSLSILNPPNYNRGSLRFQWSMNSDNDFLKYHLYSSNNEDMSSKVLIITNNIKSDTTHSVHLDLTSQTKYYQLEVEDHWGFVSVGASIQANLPFKFIKNFGGTQNDRGYAVQSVIDGYVIVGSTNSLGSGNSDVWVLKLDFEGQQVWSRVYGGQGSDFGKDIKTTSNPDGYIITGSTNSYNSDSNMDMWVIRTDDLGQTCLFDENGECSESDTKWARTFGTSGNDYGNSVVESNGEFIAVGKSGRIPSFFVVKIDAFGGKIWENLYGEGPNDNGQYVIESPGQTPKYIALGQINNLNTSDSDICIIGINSNGIEQWVRSIQYGNSVNEQGYYIFKLSGGGYIVTGTKQINHWDDLLMMKVNNDGTQSSSWTFGGSYNEVGNFAQELSDGYIVSGSTESYGQGLYDAWVVKTNDDGEEIYNHTFGGNLDDKALGGVKSINGDPVLVGYTKSFGNGGEDILLIVLDRDYQP